MTGDTEALQLLGASLSRFESRFVRRLFWLTGISVLTYVGVIITLLVKS